MKIEEISNSGEVRIYFVESDGRSCTIQTPNDRSWVEEHAKELLSEPDYEPADDTPTQLDIIEAQVLYTALMTDTLLEE